MEYILVAIKDRALRAFQPSIGTVRTNAEAIRNFRDAIISRTNQQLWNNPGDFELYIVGKFDDETGRVTPHPDPELIAVGSELRKPEHELKL